MKKIVAEEIEKYAASHTTAEAPLFQALAKETYANAEFPQMQTGHLEGTFLQLMVHAIQAKRVLEIGTFTGYSALQMATALPEEGELITCDLSEESTSIAKKYWSQSPHGKKIRLMLGDAKESIASLSGEFDLAFIDADKTNYIAYWDLVVPKMRTGGVILADNVLWSGQVLNPITESDHAIVAFNQHVKADTRVKHVLLTVRDGVTFAVKT